MRGPSIRVLRRRHGWTQADLAARLGTDPVTVSRWERGVVRPRPSARKRLRELSVAILPDVAALLRVVGEAEAERLLRRSLLLAHGSPRHRFAANPAQRIREVDRLRQEQSALKASMGA